jgi:hypothetical protein
VADGFQRSGRPQFQHTQFQQEGADQRQEAGLSRPQGNRSWDRRNPEKDHSLLLLLLTWALCAVLPTPPCRLGVKPGGSIDEQSLMESLLMPAVNLVTTRSRTLMDQWMEQYRFREQVQHLVEAANHRDSSPAIGRILRKVVILRIIRSSENTVKCKYKEL